MFSWLKKREKEPEIFNNVVDGLKQVYHSKLLPVEEYYNFHDFHSPPLEEADFSANALLLVVGQYSTGKTTFIRYILEQDFPGMRVGPEPTTDKFVILMHDNREGIIPGNALVVDSKKQFRQLSKYGNIFLNKLQCSLVKSPVLQYLSIVDTPGILSGEKQRVDRGYDFTGVLEWFSEKADRIILLFDPHKLDISDEFRRFIKGIKYHEDKIRIVLNKSDTVGPGELMRVYGALMWSLSKVLNTPEVVQVYIGSFWDKPLQCDFNRKMFDDDAENLFNDLQLLPRYSVLRKLNDIIKRARLAKVHAYLIGSVRKGTKQFFGRGIKKRELIGNLSLVYDELQRTHNISEGDFPDLRKMQQQLAKHDFSKFNNLKQQSIDLVDSMLTHDIPQLMSLMYTEQTEASSDGRIKGGVFAGSKYITPFANITEMVLVGRDDQWLPVEERRKYAAIFASLHPAAGKISGEVAKTEMKKSKLPNSVLRKIWKLADLDLDGYLDAEEFALAMHLINAKLKGYEIPQQLPENLIPASKRVGRTDS